MKLATETQIAPPGAQSGDDIELSAVMPCLNESATVGICVKKVLDAMQRHGIRGEVIVADNGSTDGSREIACRSPKCHPRQEQSYFLPGCVSGKHELNQKSAADATTFSASYL